MHEEKLYHLFEQSTSAIIIHKANTGIEYANTKALQLLGLKTPPDTLQDRTLPRQHFLEVQLANLAEKDDTTYYQPQVELRDSHGQFYSASLSIQRISQQPYATHMAIISPFTIEENHNSISTGEADLLVQLLKAETNLPLHSLLSLVDRLLNMNPREDQLPFLHKIQQSGTKLHKALEWVQLYDNLQKETVRPQHESFRLYDLLDTLESDIRFEASSTGTEFIIIKNDNCPQYLIGDHTLVQNLLELLLNFMLSLAYPLLRMEVSCLLTEASFTSVDFRLSMPIPANTPTHPTVLFTDNQAYIYNMVSQIVALLRGSLSTNGTSEGQFSLLVSLPFTIAEQPENERNLLLHDEEEKHKLAGLELLYVENATPNHLLMEGLCAMWGLNLDTALNGQEALIKIEKKQYDVVLMDLLMPVLDGYETAQLIRHAKCSATAKIPIIALSGIKTKETISQIKLCGMNDFVGKPINPDELYTKLLRFVPS